MALWGIFSQVIIFKPTENFIYSKFQITAKIVTILITFVRSSAVRIIRNVGSDVIKNKSQIYILNNKGNKGPSIDPSLRSKEISNSLLNEEPNLNFWDLPLSKF